MPTVILLDVSLSMSRLVSANDDSQTRIIDAATKNIISNLLNHLSTQCKLEYTALVVFSSLYEILVKFTRDFDALKSAFSALTTYDKTVFETAFQGVELLVTEEWGTYVPINLILVTDGSYGIGDGSLKESLKNMNNRKPENKFPLPFSFPCHLSIVCLSCGAELKENKQYLEQLISVNYGKGELLIPDSMNDVSLQQCFNKLLTLHYSKYEATLKCGHFQSSVTFSPTPNFHNSCNSIINLHNDEINLSKLKLGSSLNIVGFLDLQDFSNPPYLSRHLVLPVHVEQKPALCAIKAKEATIGLQPSFCVLLHGSLKMEKMGAVVQLSDNWYGMLYSWADNKKKSTLMISVFQPGHPFPWLGEMEKLGPAYELSKNPYQFDAKENAEETPFPVQPVSRRSYHAQANAVWIKSSGLQSDVQKLLRYARKLPDKQSAFFKEVNKLRRAGVIYGFHELLNAIAGALENEGSRMQPEANVQLRHVAEGLRNAPFREVGKNIVAINVFRKKSTEG